MRLEILQINQSQENLLWSTLKHADFAANDGVTALETVKNLISNLTSVDIKNEVLKNLYSPNYC